MKKAVISDFGGVLTTPLGHAFAAWQRGHRTACSSAPKQGTAYEAAFCTLPFA